MQSTTATSSTTFSTAVRSTSPAPPPAQDAPSHQALLSHFPSELQAEIARVFPTLQDLQAFHDDLRDNDIPLNGFKPVARMLKAARDARDLAQASLAQDRELHFHHGSGMDNVNCRDHDGATSLHNAILCYSAGKVRKLLAGGARPDLEVGPAQRKSAFVASASLARKLTMIADDSAVNETIIDALKGPLDSAASKSCTRVLIEHAGENALTLAISYEAPFEIIAMLIEHCVRHCPDLLRQVDGKGNPPLLLAAAAQRRDAINVVRMLLQCGAAIDVDQTNGLQRTALMEAVRNGDPAMVTLLLQAGASCYAVDNHGYNATAHAVLCGSPTLHMLLIDFIDKDTAGSAVETAHDFCQRDFANGIIRGQAAVISQMLAIQKQRLPGAEATVPVWKKQLFAEFIGPGLAIAVQVRGNGAVIRCLTEQVAVDEPDAIGLHLWQAAIDRDAFEALLDAACKPDMTVMDPGRR